MTQTENKNVQQNERIFFTYNWNNKLSCNAYTTIRLASNKYQLNQLYDIYLQGKKLHTATIIDICYPFLHDLNDFRTYLDTGYDCKTTTDIIRKMYKNVDFTKTRLAIILLKVVNNKKNENQKVSQ